MNKKSVDQNALNEFMEDGWSWHGGGSGELSEGKAYQQYVTDGEGKAKWEERTHYTYVENKTLVDNLSVIISDNWSASEIQLSGIIEGEIYTVTIDGIEYKCTALNVSAVDGWAGCCIFGNATLVPELMENGFADTGEPFLFGYDSTYNNSFLYHQTDGTYTVSVVGNVYVVAHMDAKYLPDVYAPYRKIHSISSKEEVERFAYELSQDAPTNAYGYINDSIVLRSYGGAVFSTHDKLHAWKDIDGEYVHQSFEYANPALRLIDNVRYVDMLSPMYVYNPQPASLYRARGVIIASSTANSTKAFAITVDDSGTLTATEVTE